MTNTNNLLEISGALTGLYSDPASINRIMDDAGLDATAISFVGSPMSMWMNVLTEAEQTDRLDQLITLITKEHGQNPQTLKLSHAYNQNKSQGFQDQIDSLEFSVKTLKIDLSALPVKDNGQAAIKERLDDLFDSILDLQKTSQGLAAQALSPPVEDLHIQVVASNSLERLEEYRTDQATWSALAGLFCGSILGILINWINGGQLNAAAWILMVAFLVVAGVFGYFFYEGRNRISNIKDKISGTPNHVPFEMNITESDWHQDKNGTPYYQINASKHKKGRFPIARFYRKLPDGVYKGEPIDTQISKNGDIKINISVESEGTFFIQ